MSTASKPLPRLDDANRPFWDGARAGELRLQRCADCGRFRFPEARHCAGCGSDASAWTAVSGRGTIEAWCRFHKAYFDGFADEMPYNVVLVRLEEGACLFSNLVDEPPDGITVGTAVVASFEPATPEVTLVKFRPAR